MNYKKSSPDNKVAVDTVLQDRHRRRWQPSGYVSVADMLESAPLSRASLYREIAAGRMPVTRWRGRVLVRAQAYRDWLATIPASTCDQTAAR